MSQSSGVTLSTVRAIACVLIAFFLGAGAVAAQTIEDFAIKTLNIKSDKDLSAKRVGCAFGDTAQIFAKLATRGIASPKIADYCIAVIREAAKRDRLHYLYYRMQFEKGPTEWQLILAAAGKNQSRYVNADGADKVLNCELAFDAGYKYGRARHDQKIAPELTDANIAVLARNCFRKDPSVTVQDGLTAGARIAQMHAKGRTVIQIGAE